MRRFAKVFFKLSVIVIIIATTLYNANLDLSKTTSTLLQMKLSTCAIIMLSFIANFYLSALRNKLAYQQFRIPISFATLQLGLLSGILGGLFPIFGSAISQSFMLNKYSGLKHSTGLYLYFYDKCIMAFSGLLVAFIAVLFLVQDWTFFKQIAIQSDGSSLLEFLIALSICIFLVVMYVLPKGNKRALFALVNLRSVSYVGVALILSFMMWCIAANCFMRAIMDFNVSIPSYNKTFAACGMISFLASLPISVNGWGVREFAAISILGFVFIPAEVALSAAIAVGILSTLSILILSGLHFTYAYKNSGGLVVNL